MNNLDKILKYKPRDPEFIRMAFDYADEYADGLFAKGVVYGVVSGCIFTLIGMSLYFLF